MWVIKSQFFSVGLMLKFLVAYFLELTASILGKQWTTSIIWILNSGTQMGNAPVYSVAVLLEKICHLCVSYETAKCRDMGSMNDSQT